MGQQLNGVEGNTINIDSTGKITITDQAIATNSGAYTVTATADSNSPVYTGTTTTTITVTVNKVALLPLTYDSATITTDDGTANDTGISPSWDLIDMTGITYSIVVATRDGVPVPYTDGAGTTINIAPNTGKITITAGASGDHNGAYVVTAEASNDSPAYIGGSTATTTIMVDVTYKVGDDGPAGGKVFYVNKENYETDGWRYLEAALNDHENLVEWGSEGKVETSTDIGTGSTNTANIVEVLGVGDNPYAAKICSDLDLGGP